MSKAIKESNKAYLVSVLDPDYRPIRSRYGDVEEEDFDNVYEDIYTALDYQDAVEYAMRWYKKRNRNGKKYIIYIEDEFGNEEEFDPSSAFRFECTDSRIRESDGRKAITVNIPKKEYDNIDEAYNCQAQMMNIRNQLMNKLGDDFAVTGGTTVPKIIVASSQRPSISFEITPNGQNVDITPRIDNIPDTLHKKKGIAYMRAGNILYDFIMDTLKSLKVESVRKLYIREEYVDDYLDMFAVVRRMIDNMAKTKFDPPLKVDFREYSDDGWYAIVKIWRSDYPELKREYELKYKDAYDGILYVHTQEENKWDIYYSQKDFIDWLFDDISWKLY